MSTRNTTPRRSAFRTIAMLALVAGLTGAAIAQPRFRRDALINDPEPQPGPQVRLEQIDWRGPFTPTINSNWGRLTWTFQGREDLFFLNVAIGDRWVVRNIGVDSPLGAGVTHTVSVFFPIAEQHGVPIEVVSMDLVATRQPVGTMNQTLLPPTLVIDSFFDVFTMVSSNEMMLGGEHGMLEMPLPVLAVPPAWALGQPIISATLPDADKIENKPQKPNHCAPGAISNSLRYLAARGVGPVGAAPITEADLAEILGTSEQNGTPADWPERKRDWFNANPQHQICTEILEGAGGDVIAKVVQAIRDGKDVELDLQGHVVFVAAIRVYADRVELDVYDDDQTDDKADPKRTVVLKSDGAGGWTCDGFGVDGFVIESRCPCPADWNRDGVVNAADFQLFMLFFQLGLPQADFNGDGIVNNLDLADFMAALNAPCP